MSHGVRRVEFVGPGMLDRAARQVHATQQRMGRASDWREVITNLDQQIEKSRRELENLLRGKDSFDTLAFLRHAVSPWELSETNESESTIESSQAAQDVIALVLLGMGLPRTPLTGINTGQFDVGEAMHLAAAIVDCSRTRAILRGRLSDQPLGSLAGVFSAYELTVRGRQYQSIAAEVNSALLLDPAVSTVVSHVLGFTLADIRATRTAAVQLFNERFFGARDRVGMLARSGRTLTGPDAEAFRNDMNLMVNECRLFGAVTSTDVSSISGIERETTRRVLDYFATNRPAASDADQVDQYRLGKITGPGGSIGDGDEYLILNGFLAEDELRRCIERGVFSIADGGKRAIAARDRYVRRRAHISEALTGSTIGRLLGGAQPYWTGQQFRGPIDPVDHHQFTRDRLPDMAGRSPYESDLLFVVDGVALCVEVKAGSITGKSRSGNATRLAEDLGKTLSGADAQADRLATLIRSNKGVWTGDGQWVDLSAVQEIHSIVVMLDDMGPLSLAMNELAEQRVVTTADLPWIVSLHDLIVFSRTMDHPAQFLEFLRRRRGRKLATMVVGADELDMLMWFVSGGMFFEPDPDDVSAQIPVPRTVRRSEVRRFENEGRLHLGTFTDPLDAWFYWEEGLSQRPAPKPVRREEPWLEAVLVDGEKTRWPGWLRAGADLVSLSSSSQRHIGRALRTVRRKARDGDRERTLTTHGTTPHGSWLLTLAAVRDGFPVDHLVDYIEAKQYQTEVSRALLLVYRPDGTIVGSHFCPVPQERSQERDSEVSAVPLRPLAETFATGPPRVRPKSKSKPSRSKRSRRSPRRT